ncbi:MAG: PAS domain-containing protein [Muribaculaceae bacterium]|nr:PAS domain-containing protein [Muribaculaceae bacterium]
MAQRGMELLSVQDTHNRLACVNQPEADRIAGLFNTLMERLHKERLMLREQDSFMRQLIQASPMGIAMMDFDSVITDFNPAFLKLTGLQADIDPKGKTLSDLPGYIASQISQMEEGEIKTIKYEGNIFLRCYLLSFSDCGFRRPFILIENMTEEVMEAERRAYDKVIRIMAHEVNNSMTGIMTLLDILADCHKDDMEISNFIESVSERCESMQRFIKAYADVVRLPPPDKKQIDLGEFILNHLPFLRCNSGYPIVYDGGVTRMMINADPDMLSQILVNIIKNANEAIDSAGRKDGRINIATKKLSDGEFLLSITDNGCGITDETATELFNPFFTTKPSGQGIGLTMVAEILRRHDALFSLRSESEGLTTFSIIFR